MNGSGTRPAELDRRTDEFDRPRRNGFTQPPVDTELLRGSSRFGSVDIAYVLPALEIIDPRIGDTGAGGAVAWRTPLRCTRRGPGRSTAPCARRARAMRRRRSWCRCRSRWAYPPGDTQQVPTAAEEVARPFIPRLPYTDRAAVTQGYAGVYPSFLLHAE
ncbi:hypothetical protein ACFU8W_17755 [Streptomyces sp. NPDC057565]|uniref:hypothetical protein n=1 Tax=Streptomyces sp. NPDC057565 TaxID=3346169 RepID=UPI0036BC4E2E